MSNAGQRGVTANIMVVDDTMENLGFLTEMLQKSGYTVRPVMDAMLALNAAILHPPDLIILDIMMPGMGGYEVCEKLKQCAGLNSIPVIFISALNEVFDKVRAFNAGGVDYISKPFNYEEVNIRVKTHLELARLRHEMENYSRNLEIVVDERTRELKRANEQLSILDQSKTDFLNLIAHELRTPLCGVFGATEILLAVHDEKPEIEDCRSIYLQSRKRINTLIDDALLLTEIGMEMNQYSRMVLDLKIVMTQVMEQAAEFARFRKVTLNLIPFESCIIEGIEEHIVRALVSLVETAVKFTYADHNVILRCQKSAHYYGIVIETAGQTIPEQVLPIFFEMLSIMEPITPGGDLGLGPALAQRIMRLHEGMVTVENVNTTGIRIKATLKCYGRF